MNNNQSNKEKAIEVINTLPDDCSMEDIQYHLYVREKVERGIKAIDEGLTVSQANAEKKIGRASCRERV